MNARQAEINFGLLRHAAHAAGSDGAISGRLVEVKTISPDKSSDRVNGDFEQLLIVRIGSDFRFAAKLLERSALQGSTGKFLRGGFKRTRASLSVNRFSLCPPSLRVDCSQY